MATPLSLKRIGLEQGISQSTIYAIIQDKSGYIWLGTGEGIDVYDGYSFKYLRHKPEDINSLSGNYVKALMLSQDGSIWVGTLGNGLNRYDPETGTFIRYQSKKNDRSGIANADIYSLFESKDGRIWIGKDEGVSVFDPTTSQFKHYVHSAGNPVSINIGAIRAITETTDGTMWFGSSQSGISSLTKGTDNFRFFSSDKDDPASLSDNAINALYQDKKGNLWIGTEYGGLNKLDLKTNVITRYQQSSANEDSLNDSEVTSFFEDSKGGLWLGTWSGGLNYFDPVGEVFKSYRYSQANTSSISSDTVISLFEDQSGMLWAGTFDGGVNLINYQGADFEHYQYDPVLNNGVVDKMIWAISEDKAEDIWIGTKKGLSQFDPRNGKFTSYFRQGQCLNVIETLDIRSILPDNKLLWLGTAGGGLIKFNPQNCDVEVYLHDEKDLHTLSDNHARLLLKDQQGQLWIGTRYGLNKLDLSSGEITRYQADSTNTRALAHNRIRSLYQDDDGIIWIGTSGGLSRYNKISDDFDNFTFEQGLLSENDVRDIWKDKEGVLWIATGHGLTRFDLTLQQAQFWHEKDGLANNTLYKLLVDNEFLWITTNHGLSRFDRQTHQFTNFDISDGLQSNEFNINAALKSKSGHFYVGGVKGFNRFHPDTLNRNKIMPQVDFKVQSDALEATTIDFSEPQSITLNATDRNINFTVSVMHYLNTAKNEFQYQLSGFDDNWIKVNARNKEIKYTSLPRGKYVLNIKVKASNGLSSHEDIKLDIIVRPELWKTWWAYATYMVVLFFLIYTLLQLRTKELRNRAEHLKRLIQAKTLELQQKNSHLGNKSYELETLLKNQDDFYLKVAHELRTPLTLIQIPAELLLTENVSEQSRANLEVIFNAVSRMKNLTEQMFLAARSGKVKQPGVVTFDLNAHIRSITYIYQLAAFEKNIEYIVKPIPNASVTIKQQVLESTLHNLLSNAIRYTDVDGQVTVEVSLCDNWLQLIVKDNGIGIPESEQGIIFDRFCRTSRAQQFAVDGDGIGLYTVMQDLKNCGGAINVDSEEGIGSEFTVCIPCQSRINPSDSVRSERPTSNKLIIDQESESPIITSLIDKPSLLIIEEDIEIRHLLTTLLKTHYQVTSTGSAKKGQKLALQMELDLVLCDVLLPDGSGYEITQTLKNNTNTAHIPIILLSSIADIAGYQEGWDNGADDYIIKPFLSDDLLQRIDAIIKNRQRLKEYYLAHFQALK